MRQPTSAVAAAEGIAVVAGQSLSGEGTPLKAILLLASDIQSNDYGLSTIRDRLASANLASNVLPGVATALNTAGRIKVLLSAVSPLASGDRAPEIQHSELSFDAVSALVNAIVSAPKEIQQIVMEISTKVLADVLVDNADVKKIEAADLLLMESQVLSSFKTGLLDCGKDTGLRYQLSQAPGCSRARLDVSLCL